MTGIVPVDLEKLAAQVGRYVSNVVWNADYISVNGAHVLVIAVDPPTPGDPIHVLRHGTSNYEAGTVFVRRAASTDRANADEMDMLQQRLLASKNQLDLKVELVRPTIERWPAATVRARS